jgi:hypothetical protein
MRIARSGPEPSIERIDSLIQIAARRIKQLSHTGVTIEDSSTWVTEAFPAPETMLTFVNNLPIEVLKIISLGVYRYTEGGIRDTSRAVRSKQTVNVPL